jgi:hypothetical protein
MTLATDEFIRRFLIHVLPKGFHRICHYGLFAGTARLANLSRMRTLLEASEPARERHDQAEAEEPIWRCPCCGAPMRIVETFERGETPRQRPSPAPTIIRIDTS